MRRRFTDDRGFTLFELVIAMVVLSILLAMAALNGPVFLAHNRLASAARQVATDLRLVRAKAVTQTSSFRVVFANGAASYTVERSDGAGGWTAHALHAKALAAEDPVIVALPEPVRLASAQTIVFEPRGNVTAPAAVPLRVPALPGVARTVDVSFTGEVRIR